MFGYNPTVQDRSGEITAQGTINAANSISQGIGQLGQGLQQGTQGITGAINQINGMKFQAAQTDATAQAAHGMGILDDRTLKMIQELPWQQKINLGSNLIQMIGQKTMADRYNAMLDLNQTKAANAADKTLTQF